MYIIRNDDNANATVIDTIAGMELLLAEQMAAIGIPPTSGSTSLTVYKAGAEMREPIIVILDYFCLTVMI